MYRGEIQKMMNGEKFDFEIDTSNPAEAMKSIRLLKLVVKEMDSQIEESGFGGKLLGTLTLGLLPNSRRDTVVNEKELQEKLVDIVTETLESAITQIADLKNEMQTIRTEMQVNAASQAQQMQEIRAMMQLLVQERQNQQRQQLQEQNDWVQII